MGWLAKIIGIDEKTQALISALGRSLFVGLIVISIGLAIGDALKLIWYYILDWRSGEDAGRSDETSD